MFNGKKLKELEQRIKLLEGNVGQDYETWKADLNNMERVVGGHGVRLPVRAIIRDIIDHLSLEYKTTPETTQLVVKK